VGAGVGAAVGGAVGSGVGAAVGTAVGAGVGAAVGSAVGTGVGAAVGSGVGTAVGSAVGAAVGRGGSEKDGSEMSPQPATTTAVRRKIEAPRSRVGLLIAAVCRISPGNAWPATGQAGQIVRRRRNADGPDLIHASRPRLPPGPYPPAPRG
jgi:hypothetical protein